MLLNILIKMALLISESDTKIDNKLNIIHQGIIGRTEYKLEIIQQS